MSLLFEIASATRYVARKYEKSVQLVENRHGGEVLGFVAEAVERAYVRDLETVLRWYSRGPYAIYSEEMSRRTTPLRNDVAKLRRSAAGLRSMESKVLVWVFDEIILALQCSERRINFLWEIAHPTRYGEYLKLIELQKSGLPDLLD